MTFDWPIAARALNDAASLAWFGLALAPAYGGPRCFAARQIAGVVALLSLAVFAVFTMANIVGPGASLRGAEIVAILGRTSFGHVWILRAGLCAAALLLASQARTSAVLAGMQLALLGFGGHAFARGGLLGASSQAAHLLAAGAWLGGVVALALLQRRDLLASAGRFSRPGYVMASLAPVTGLAMLAFIDGSMVPRIGTDYGSLAAAKLAQFFVLLGLAAANRFYALPRGNILALRAGIVAELVMMAALSLTAAALASTSPAM